MGRIGVGVVIPASADSTCCLSGLSLGRFRRPLQSFENNPFQPPSPANAKEAKARLDLLQAKKKVDEEVAAKAAEEATGVIKMPTVSHRASFGTVNKVELIEFDTAALCDGAVVVMSGSDRRMASVTSCSRSSWENLRPRPALSPRLQQSRTACP